MERVLAFYTGDHGLDIRRGHMCDQFLQSCGLVKAHSVCTWLENGIRLAVVTFGISERQRRRQCARKT